MRTRTRTRAHTHTHTRIYADLKFSFCKPPEGTRVVNWPSGVREGTYLSKMNDAELRLLLAAIRKEVDPVRLDRGECTRAAKYT